MSVYRRGAVYWWHRQVSWPIAPLCPTKLRLSLKTSEKSEARTRALALDTELEMLHARVLKEGAPAAPEQLSKAYQAALSLKRDQIAKLEAQPPFDDSKLRDEHIAMRQLFAAITRNGLAMSSPEIIAVATEDPTLSERQVALISELANSYGRVPVGHPKTPDERATPPLDPPYPFVWGGYSLPPTFVSHFMSNNGIADTEANRRLVLAVVAAAYSDAHKEAEACLSQPMATENSAVPRTLRKMMASCDFGAQQEPSLRVRQFTSDPQKEPQGDLPWAKPVTSLPSQAPELIDLKLSELTALAIATYAESGNWQDSAQRNAKVIADIFIAENGDLRMSEIESKHVIAVRRRLETMPTIWGKSSDDRRGGLASVFARGEALKAKWNAAKTEEEKKGLAKIGFSAPTINRHMLTLKQLFDFVRDLDDGIGNKTHVAPRASFSKLTVRDRRKKNRRKPVPTPHEMHQLLSSPLHTGCAGPSDRFREGDVIIHDSGYWMVLILAVYGSRSNEFCQLPLAHVFDQETIPFFRILGCDLQAVKTEATNRDLPIAPKLIELGFIDYVRALRERGEMRLFPELNTTKEPPRKVFMDDVFRPLMQCVFPHGTSAKRGDKDIDTQYFRKFATTTLRQGPPKIDLGMRQAFFGHERETTLEGTYEDDPTVEEFLPCVMKTQKLIAHIQPAPLRLRS